MRLTVVTGNDDNSAHSRLLAFSRDSVPNPRIFPLKNALVSDFPGKKLAINDNTNDEHH